MNSRQARKLAREFVKEVVKLLPAEYSRELTKQMLDQERRLEILQNQLMKRDGYVIHETDDA